MAAALAEAGLYYAGERSFFWTPGNMTARTQTTQSRHQYQSPIENECQNNYIILVTDGFSSVDSGILGRSYYSNDNSNKWSFAGRQDMIYYLNDYLPSIPPDVRPAIKIDGNRDVNTNAGSYGYITWKTSHAGTHSDDIGSKLQPYVFDFWWTKAKTDKLTGAARAYDSSYYSLTPPVWNNIDPAGPPKPNNSTIITDIKFGVNRYFNKKKIEKMISTNNP